MPACARWYYSLPCPGCGSQSILFGIADDHCMNSSSQMSWKDFDGSFREFRHPLTSFNCSQLANVTPHKREKTVARLWKHLARSGIDTAIGEQRGGEAPSQADVQCEARTPGGTAKRLMNYDHTFSSQHQGPSHHHHHHHTGSHHLFNICIKPRDLLPTVPK